MSIEMARLITSPAGGFEADLESLSLGAREVIEEIRGFETAAFRLLLTNELTDGQRPSAMVALLQRARRATIPDLAIAALERAEREWAQGRPRDAWYSRAAIEDTVIRDAKPRRAT